MEGWETIPLVESMCSSTVDPLLLPWPTASKVLPLSKLPLVGSPYQRLSVFQCHP